MNSAQANTQSQQEKRVYMRTDISGNLKYTLLGGLEPDKTGTLVNISSTGLGCRLKEKIKIGESLIINFQLPNYPKLITAIGVVKFQKEKVNWRNLESKSYMTGLLLMRLKDADKSLIVQYILSRLDIPWLRKCFLLLGALILLVLVARLLVISCAYFYSRSLFAPDIKLIFLSNPFIPWYGALSIIYGIGILTAAIALNAYKRWALNGLFILAGCGISVHIINLIATYLAYRPISHSISYTIDSALFIVNVFILTVVSLRLVRDKLNPHIA